MAGSRNFIDEEEDAGCGCADYVWRTILAPVGTFLGNPYVQATTVISTTIGIWVYKAGWAGFFAAMELAAPWVAGGAAFLGVAYLFGRYAWPVIWPHLVSFGRSFWDNFCNLYNLLGVNSVIGGVGQLTPFGGDHGYYFFITYGFAFIGAIVTNAVDLVLTSVREIFQFLYQHPYIAGLLLAGSAIATWVGSVGLVAFQAQLASILASVVGGVIAIAPFVMWGTISVAALAAAIGLTYLFSKHAWPTIWSGITSVCNLAATAMMGLFELISRHPYITALITAISAIGTWACFVGWSTFTAQLAIGFAAVGSAIIAIAPFVMWGTIVAASVATIIGLGYLFQRYAWPVLVSVTENLGRAFYNNFSSLYNLLGDRSMFGLFEIGRLDPYNNNPHLFYKIVTWPFAAACAVVSNTVNSVLTAGVAVIIGAIRLIFGLDYLFQKYAWPILWTCFEFIGRHIYATAAGAFVSGVGAWIYLAGWASFKAQLVSGLIAIAPFVMWGTIAAASVATIIGLNYLFQRYAWPVLVSVTENLGRAFYNNFSSLYNLLGDRSVFGLLGIDRLDPYNNNPHLFYKIMTWPFAAVCAVVSNTVNSILTASVAAIMGTIGLLGLMIRKTFMGLYNFTIRPIVDRWQGKTFDGLRMLKGALNFVTLGLFSAIRKLIQKGCFGYTKRFGYPSNYPEIAQPVTALDHFNQTQRRFRDAIHLAATGGFPGVRDSEAGFLTLFSRVGFHVRHSAEEIVKKIHDIYCEYKNHVDTNDVKGEDVPRADRYSLVGFFGSRKWGKYRALMVNDFVKSQGDDYYRRQNIGRFNAITASVEEFLCDRFAAR